MRGRMNDAKSYAPKQELNEVMTGRTVGEVIESRNPKFKQGDIVQGTYGWQQYGCSDGAGVRRVDASRVPMSAYLGVLGMPGVTAWVGLLDICQPQVGETVVVSAASGAVGSAVGQIAKLMGCRAVGIAGGKEKCDYVTAELGFDACIDYKSGAAAVKDGLKEHCPKGVDIYFDNVGGEILDTVLTRINRKARIIICGAISQYNNTTAVQGPKNYLSLLVNRARMEGIVVFDYADRYHLAIAEMAGYLKDGRMKSKEDVVTGGVAAFPAALPKLFSGENFGKLVLQVAQTSD
jgi:NADPH-dependent curcumin reductase CurA